jgi:three-Cys-motif partner protein
VTVPSTTIWKLEPHTRAKHEILKLYLQRWFPILNTHHGRMIYVDGFCGPGRYSGGEPGSPLVVLDLAANHIKTLSGDLVFWFIDERDDRIEHLKSELTGVTFPPNFNIKPETGRFDEKLKELLDRTDQLGIKLAPAFIFIDPFGFSGVPYTLVKRTLANPRWEVLITFMVDSINRWLDHPNVQISDHIADIFGTADSFKIDRKSPNRIGVLRDLYQKQLEKVAKFVRYFEMRDRTGRVEYLLFFATNNRLGHKKMKEAMWAVDPQGEFRFSDATNSAQQVMFEGGQADLLWPLLKQTFSGKEVLTESILEWVEDETAFLDKHMKATLRNHENALLPANDRITVNVRKADGKMRIKGTFPVGVRMTFP